MMMTRSSIPDASRRLALLALALLGVAGCATTAGSSASDALIPAPGTVLLDTGWRFTKGDPDEATTAKLSYDALKQYILPTGNAFSSHPVAAPATPFVADVAWAQPGFDDSAWRKLNIPHDWAVEGPFDQALNGETGKLPYPGIAWYRNTFAVAKGDVGKHVELELDGAMSYSEVFVNGTLVGGWPYGYASYSVDLSKAVKEGENTVAIRLQNPENSSRWYPGAGIYRNVRLHVTSPVRLADWGTYVTTPHVTESAATVSVRSEVAAGVDAAGVTLTTTIYELKGNARREVAAMTSSASATPVSQEFNVASPKLWSIETPNLYLAKVTLSKDGKVVDTQESTFGIRTAEFTLHDGFHLNGKRVQINGVCDHHDLGALGSAVNYRATERQLEVLKEMGCNAIRTSHNPPSPELIALCEKMGFVVMCEAFDCWHTGKTQGDYHNVFDEWHEQDVRSMVRHYRNSPAVVLWSLGNEIPDEPRPAGPKLAAELRAAARLEDQTRPTIAASNHGQGDTNGFAKALDVYGINYFTSDADKFRAANPDKPFLYSESASTISSRGEYFFGTGKRDWMSDFQVDSYDLHYPGWASTPDRVFKSLDQHPEMAGEFVWTGWDYIGEPTPYNRDLTNLLNYSDPVERARAEKELKDLGKIATPSRSSYFGIVDLAGFKKDRFYVYQARWRPELPMAHLLPHWTWPGREGEVTPVMVYTSGDEAEVFLNGTSLGRKRKAPFEYRLTWPDVKYAPGELTVVAYKDGKVWAHDVVRTAGDVARLAVLPDRTRIAADGRDLSFISVTLLDAKGTTVPRAKNDITFAVEGPGEVVATDNGDATSHVSFQSPTRPAYNGKALGIIRRTPGGTAPVKVTVSSPGLPSVTVELK
jgi:beta-galactosidase